MKVLISPTPATVDSSTANKFTLPQGLIGFRSYTQAELLYLPDSLPFLWMKLSGPEGTVSFVVIEPGGLIDGYTPELFADDATVLDLRANNDAMVLNIVTLNAKNPSAATANLIGPIIVNRRTRVGRQLVISNHTSYSAHYQLVDNTAAAVA